MELNALTRVTNGRGFQQDWNILSGCHLEIRTLCQIQLMFSRKNRIQEQVSVVLRIIKRGKRLELLQKANDPIKKKYKDDYGNQTTNTERNGHWCTRYELERPGIFNVKCIKINAYLCVYTNIFIYVYNT